jgi:SAM-dependent MidA family methyltransferase
MVHPNRRTPLTGHLIESIQNEGPINFAEFMRACLYHPEHGYYTSRVPKTGRRDFFTSPEVGPQFGRLLAWQFREMWERLGRPERFDLVECGGGDGRLARDILARVAESDADFAAALRFTLVEISEAQREQAAAHLEPFGEQCRVTGDLPAGPVTGCVYSNELLDAFPVHRVVQREAGLREILVGTRKTAKGIELAEVEGDPSTPALADYLARYGAPLQEGQVAEISLEALAWIEKVASVLGCGWLLTVDYGFRARELYGPGRLRGTLLAYRNHRTNEDWLGWPGLQDLTAHVNFSALEERGRELGIDPLGLVTQTQFLLSLGRASGFLQELEGGSTDRKTLEQLQQFKELIHPGGMGETFKVLLQGKRVPEGKLSGLDPL